MDIDTDVLEVLRSWRQQSQFVTPDDWVFASSVQVDVAYRLSDYDEIRDIGGTAKYAEHTRKLCGWRSFRLN